LLYLFVLGGTMRIISFGLKVTAWFMKAFARADCFPKGGFNPIIYITEVQTKFIAIPYLLLKFL
jgi:hypothetical protein